MRIAFDAQFLYDPMKTGIGKSAEYLLRNLSLKNEYFLNVSDVRKHDLQSEVLESLVSKGFNKAECPWYLNSIASKMANWVDVPYSFLFPIPVDATVFFNFIVPRGVKGKVITIIHDMTYKTFPETVEEVTRRNLDRNMDYVIKRADCILSVSEFSRQELIHYFPNAETKSEVISWGVDTNLFHPHYSLHDENKIKKKYQINSAYILYVGTLEPRKNIIRLIEAYAKLYRKEENLPKLVISGKKGWMYEGIFEIVRRERLEEKVIFTGYIEDADMPVLMSGAEFFVFLSLYEGFGLPPLEAMACGTPVLVSNVASLPEVIGKAGILVDPYDTDEIANSMEKLVWDENKRMALKVVGLERVKTYSWEKAARKMEDIFMTL